MMHTGVFVAVPLGYQCGPNEYQVKMHRSTCFIHSFEAYCPSEIGQIIGTDEFLSIIDTLNGLMQKDRRYYPALVLIPLIPICIGIFFLAQPSTNAMDDMGNDATGMFLLLGGLGFGTIAALFCRLYFSSCELNRVRTHLPRLNTKYQNRLLFRLMDHSFGNLYSIDLIVAVVTEPQMPNYSAV